MSESPKSRMFRFAAILNWAKNKPGYRCVLSLLVILCLIATWCATASAQPPLEFPGQAIHTIVFETEEMWNASTDANKFPAYRPYTDEEVAAIIRVVTYINDIIDVHRGGGSGQTVTFWKRDIATATGGGNGVNSGGVTVNDLVFPVGTNGEQSSQTHMHYYENMMTHELGHVMWLLFDGPGEYTTNADGTITFTSVNTNNMRLADGSAIQTGVAYNPNNIVYYGQNTREVFGDFWHSGQVRGTGFDLNNGGFGHPNDPDGGVMTYRGYLRDFFSEAELAMLQDQGHQLDRSRFYGRSLYHIYNNDVIEINSGNINNNRYIAADGTTGWLGDGIFGVGLHLARNRDEQTDDQAAGNTVLVNTHLVSTGYLGAGIRIEGVNHTVTIMDGVIVAGNGEEGIGVVTAQEGGGTVLTNFGRIEATGLNGTGVWFNTNVTSFDNHGIIFAKNAIDGTLNNAIFIDLETGSNNGWGWVDGVWRRNGTRVDQINFHDGTQITGNIVTESNLATEFNVIGKTLIDGEVRIRDNTLLVMATGGIGAGANTDPNAGEFGTLIIVEGGFVMEDGSTLYVNLGDDYISGSTTIKVSDKIEVQGVADIGRITIDIMELIGYGGSYELLSAGLLSYDSSTTTITFKGEIVDIGSSIEGKRATIDLLEVFSQDNTIKLDISVSADAGDLSNIRVSWSGDWLGDYYNTWYSYDFDKEEDDPVNIRNWSGIYFLEGDGVIFGRRALNETDPNIYVVDNLGQGHKLVADMTIRGGLDWIFNSAEENGVEKIVGNAEGISDTEKRLKDGTGMLWMNGTGTVLLNIDTEFYGNGLLEHRDDGSEEGITIQHNPDGLAGRVSSGTLILNAYHDFQGGVLIDPAGTLQIGNGGTTGNYFNSNADKSGDIKNNGLVVFNRSDEVNFEYGISGTGSLTQSGTGELNLRGDSTTGYTYTYTGATTVERSTLNVSNLDGTSAIDVRRGATLQGLYGSSQVLSSGLVLNRGTITNLGVLGAGGIANLGRMDTIAKVQTDMFINQGVVISGQSMDVRMSKDSDPRPPALLPRGTFINDEGVLTVGTLNKEGTNFSGVGTLNIDGHFENIQGTINVTLNGSQNSQIIVTNGTATIDGGSLNVILNNNPFELNRQYDFIVADEGLTVIQDLVVGGLYDPLLQMNVAQSTGSYGISLSRTFIYAGEGDTPTQRAMGKYVDLAGEKLFAKNPNGDLRNVLLALDNARLTGSGNMQRGLSRGSVGDAASAAGINDPTQYALTQMSGSVYGTATTASFQNTVMLHASLANVLRRDYNTINTINTYYGRSGPPTGNLWGMLYGHAGSSKYDGNVNGYHQGLSGIMVGSDRLNERRLRLGLFLSMGEGSLSSDLQDRVLSKEFMLGHYFRRDTDHSYVLFQAGLGNHRYDTRRQLTFIGRTATNQHSAFLGTAHFETGLRYRSSIVNFAPFVGVQYTGLVREGFTERGAGSLNLTTDLEDYHSVRTMFGLRFDSVPFNFRKGLVSFYGNAAWMYEFEASRRHTEFTARFTDSGILYGDSFTINGNDPGRDWVQAGFGANYDINAHFRGFVGYDAYANQNQVMHSVNLGFIYQK